MLISSKIFNIIKFSSNYKQFLRTLLTASIDNLNVTVDRSDHKPMKFPQIWLRDNCYCSECFHDGTKSRIYKFQIDTKAEKVKSLDEESIQIKWSDDHVSVYNFEWLKEREFHPGQQHEYIDGFYRPKPVLWGKDQFETVCKHFDFEDILGTMEGLKHWMESLATYGVAIIDNAPAKKDSIRKISDQIGFIRKTQYGEEYIVSAKPGTTNYAYLSSSLPMHTDLPYYEYKPGLNLLHCMTQSESIGGHSLLADGFHVADRVRQEDPASYEILRTIPVDWNDIGQDEAGGFHSIFRSPVINANSEGTYQRINFSIPQRDSHFTIPLADVIPWYEAAWKFVQILKEEIHAFKLKEGQILCFNNLRLLHGRSGYDDKDTNVRYIIGAYLDWDIFYSKLRLLKSKKAV